MMNEHFFLQAQPGSGATTRGTGTWLAAGRFIRVENFFLYMEVQRLMHYVENWASGDGGILG